MPARQRQSTSLYALADGTVIRASGAGEGFATIGVVVKDRDRRTVTAFAEQVKAANQVEAQCRSLIAALDAARMYGAEAVTVYCPNSAVVAELNRELPRNPDLTKLYPLITAHMNRFRRASVRHANARNWEPLQLARDHASRMSGYGVARTASLFPTAA